MFIAKTLKRDPSLAAAILIGQRKTLAQDDDLS